MSDEELTKLIEKSNNEAESLLQSFTKIANEVRIKINDAVLRGDSKYITSIKENPFIQTALRLYDALNFGINPDVKTFSSVISNYTCGEDQNNIKKPFK